MYFVCFPALQFCSFYWDWVFPVHPDAWCCNTSPIEAAFPRWEKSGQISEMEVLKDTCLPGGTKGTKVADGPPVGISMNRVPFFLHL